MKSINIFIVLFSLVLLQSACGKKESKPVQEEAPKVCSNTCKSWEERAAYPDCTCYRPELKLPDAKLQAQLINAALTADLGFIMKQIDENHINQDAYLGLSEMENLLAFRTSLSGNKYLYNNIKKDTSDLTLAYIAATMPKGYPLLQLLAERGANFNKPSIKGQTPIEPILENKDTKSLTLLLENGAKADLFSEPNNYLAQSIEKGDFDTAKVLINYAQKNGIVIDAAYPSLEKAVKDKNSKMVTFLIDTAKASPNQTDAKGNPVISAAALSGNKEIVMMLLLAGADIEQINPQGQTPLMTLIKESGTNAGNLNDMSNFFIENGADINALDLNGETPLFYAVREKNEELIKNFIAKGADINARNNKGESVIFIPAANDDKKMAKFLLDNGASARLKNRQKVDAATLAVQMGYMDTYDIIESYK